MRRGVSPVKSRRYPAAIALCGTAACTIAAAFVTSNALAIAFISASLFLVYATSTCAWALSSVAAPTNCTASIGAMQNFGGYLGGALAPTVTGLIVQQTGSFVPALVVGALIGAASAGSYLFIVDQPITAADLDAVSHHGAAPRLRAGLSDPDRGRWLAAIPLAAGRGYCVASVQPTPGGRNACVYWRSLCSRRRFATTMPAS